MKKIFCIAVMTILQFALPVFAIEDIDGEIKEGQMLQLSDCVKIAVKNSPVIKKAEKNYLISKHNVSLAKSAYFPTLQAGVGYLQKFNSDITYDDGFTKRNSPMVGVHIDQLIYNFGKTTSLIDMQKFNRIAAEYRYVDSICETINDIKLKYFEVLEAKAILKVQEENVKINEQILSLTKSLYAQKKKTELDYINAQVYYTESMKKLEKAKNQKDIAYADLCNAMYVAGSPDFTIKEIDVFNQYDAFFTPQFISSDGITWRAMTGRVKEKGIGTVQELPFTLEEAWKTAYENSPDLKVLKSTHSAMQEQLKHVKRQYYPTLKGNVGYDYDDKWRSDNNHRFNNHQLNVAVNLTSSLNFMAYKHEVDRAKLVVAQAETDIAEIEQYIYYNVKKCYLNVKTAERQISNAKNTVNRALDNLKIAGEEYIDGRSDYIQLQTARANYNSAMVDYFNEIHNYSASLAKLEKAAHRHADEVYAFASNVMDSPVQKDKDKNKNNDKQE